MSPQIHATAIVDPAAELADDVEVGPYAIIEKDVKIGAGCKIGAYVHIDCGTRMGERNQVYSHATLGFPPQHLGYDFSPTRLIIGDDNVLREYVNIHRGMKEDSDTIIGNSNFLMGKVHVAHDCHIGDNNIMANSAGIAGHVHIGSRCFISGLTGVHQGCRIGDMAMIGGVSKVTQDIPPFMTADGHPAHVHGLNSLGLRRGGLAPHVRSELKRLMKTIYAPGRNLRAALEALNLNDYSEQGRYLIEFCQQSDRGLASFRP